MNCDPKILRKTARIAEAAFGRIRAGHADAEHVFGAERIDSNRGDQRRIDPTAQANHHFAEAAFANVIARATHKRTISGA